MGGGWQPPRLRLHVALDMGPLDTPEPHDPTAFGGPGDWTDLSDRIRSYSCQRGRQDQLAEFEPSTITVQLDNTDRLLDPDYSGGLVYRGTGAGLPLCPVRVSADWQGTNYPLFRGLLGPEGWPCETSRVGPEAWSTLHAFDRLGYGIDMPGSSWGIYVAGTRPDWWIRGDVDFPVLGDDAEIPDRSGTGSAATIRCTPGSGAAFTTPGLVGFILATDSADTDPALNLQPDGAPVEVVSAAVDVMPDGDEEAVTVGLIWMGWPTTDDQTIVRMEHPTSGQDRWTVRCRPDGTIYVTTYTAAGVVVDTWDHPIGLSGPWNQQTPHLVVVVVDGDELTLSVRGVTSTGTATAAVYTSDLVVGGADTGQSFDEIILWRRALTESELIGFNLMGGGIVQAWHGDTWGDRLFHWWDAAGLTATLDDTEQWHLPAVGSGTGVWAEGFWGLGAVGSIPGTWAEGVRQTAEAGDGVAWVTRDGWVRVRTVHALTDPFWAWHYSDVIAHLTDEPSPDPDPLPIRRGAITPSGTRLDRVINESEVGFAVVGTVNGRSTPYPMTVRSRDESSIARFGRLRRSRETPWYGWVHAVDMAQRDVDRWAEPPVEIGTVTLHPWGDDDLTGWLLADVELERAVQVTRTPPSGDPITTVLQIQSEAWSWDAGTAWTVTLSLAPS